jgi:hypothetical protein
MGHNNDLHEFSKYAVSLNLIQKDVEISPEDSPKGPKHVVRGLRE